LTAGFCPVLAPNLLVSKSCKFWSAFREINLFFPLSRFSASDTFLRGLYFVFGILYGVKKGGKKALYPSCFPYMSVLQFCPIFCLPVQVAFLLMNKKLKVEKSTFCDFFIYV
jgi:hypothetical protein